jgi:hypothetical protein
MTPFEEKKYLAAVLKQIDSGPPKAFQSFWTDLIVWLIAAAIFLAIFVAGEKLHPLVRILIPVFVGIGLGAFGFLQLAAKQWPYLRQHVNRESIVGRLSELEP